MQIITVSISDLQMMLDRQADRIINSLPQPKDEPTPLTNGKRFVDTNGVAKYLKCPRAQVYQLQHKGVLKGQTLPGSRRLYFDLDLIDKSLTQ